MEGQPYNFFFKIELPETDDNLNMGNFMVKMVINGQSTRPPDKPSEYRWSKSRWTKDLEDIPVTLSSSKSVCNF